jgi:tetratricopeptide (TPR) repeat protein
MSELLRGTTTTEGSSREPDAAGRDARIEQLLLSGLDQYFDGRYEQAIDIWTRVVFLERRHGRARAYIERARSAVAERQRESEELLHRSLAAYHEGHLETAKALVAQSVERGGQSEAALLLFQRLRRLEPIAALQPAGLSQSLPAALHASAPAVSSRTPWLPTVVACVVTVMLVVAVATPVTSWLAERPVAGSVAPRPIPRDPLPLAEPSEGRVRRARVLHDAGRSREALRLLETIRLGDPLRIEADRLRADVERSVLRTVGAVATVRVPEVPVPDVPVAEANR